MTSREGEWSLMGKDMLILTEIVLFKYSLRKWSRPNTGAYVCSQRLFSPLAHIAIFKGRKGSEQAVKTSTSMLPKSWMGFDTLGQLKLETPPKASAKVHVSRSRLSCPQFPVGPRNTSLRSWIPS